MTAIFLPTMAERRNSVPFMARFVLNRLALPPHTRHILVVDQDGGGLADAFEHDFDAVIEWTDRRKISGLAQNQDWRSRHEKLPPETVAAVQQQFADTLQITDILRRLKERRPGDFNAQIHFRSRSGSSIEYADIVRENYLLPIARFPNRRVTPARILGIVNHQTKRLYHLDDGVPYRNSRVLPGMAIVESLGDVTLDIPNTIGMMAAEQGNPP
jgi:hypothetical protein